MRWIIILLACTGLAQAEDLNFSWTNPTRVVSCNDAGPYNNPQGVRLWKLVAEIDDPAQEINTYTLPGVKPGTYVYTTTSYAEDGSESMISNSVTKEVTEFVTTAPNVHYIIQQSGRFLPIVVGTVPLGTPCDPEQGVNGMYAVDTDFVDWTATARPLVVVASCG